MLRIGLVAGESGHLVPFARLLSQRDGISLAVASDDGRLSASVSAAVSGADGCRVVDSVEQLCDEVDAAMVLDDGDRGAVHARHAEPLLRAGLPTFVDKPLMPGLAPAERLVELAREHDAPLMSASSARYAPGLDPFREAGADPWSSLYVSGPGEWWFYGVHLVEIVIAVLGRGIGRVTGQADDGGTVARLRHRGGASVLIELTTDGAEGFAVTGRSAGRLQSASLVPPFTSWYERLVEDFLTMAASRAEPIDLDETLEVMRVLDAVERAAGHAQPVDLVSA